MYVRFLLILGFVARFALAGNGDPFIGHPGQIQIQGPHRATPPAGCPTYVLDWGGDQAEAIGKLKFLPVSQSILPHPIEQRGLVEVPIDYSRPKLGTLNIFYRFIPPVEGSLEDRTKPVIVVINGGPGLPSSIYRDIDYDYDLLPADRLSQLSQEYRVLMIDQRGTAGYSAPLDLNHPGLRPEVIARYFDSDEHALDTGRVVSQVLGDNPFVLLCQSYGGNVGFQYLRQQANLPRPVGYIMASAAYPGLEVRDKFLSRRAEQLRLQKDLKTKIPGIDRKLMALRTHLQDRGLNPSWVHRLWAKVGWGKEGEWQVAFEGTVDSLLGMNRDQLIAQFDQLNNTVHFLNYVLSSSALSPGYTDNTMAEMGMREIPFEAWMVDENLTLIEAGAEVAWQRAAIAAMDQNPPPPTDFGSLDELRAAIAETQVLFTFGDNDAFLPPRYGIPASEVFRVRGHTLSVNLPGGHPAIWGADGVDAIRRWLRTN
jgi:pimeloyl-ACP methyl ester carboxylesterase